MLVQVRQVLLGNGLAQALQLLSAFLLSRVYPPSAFGIAAQVQSWATAIAIAMTLQMHLTIPLARNEKEAKNSLKAVKTIVLMFLLIVGPLLAVVYPNALLVIILALFVGLSNTFSNVLIYRADFLSLSRFYICRAVLIISCQLIFSLSGIEIGLLAATLFGEGLATLYLYIRVGKSFRGFATPREALRLAKARRAFSVFGTAQELISVAAFYAPLIFYASEFGRTVSGQYSMASRLVWAPVILLSGSFAQVLYHRYGQIQGSLRELVNPSAFLILGAVSSIASGIAFASTGLFHLLLGAKWGIASQMIPITLIWGIIFLFSTPFRVAGRAMQLQRYQLSIDLLALTSVWLVFQLGLPDPIRIMWLLVGVALVQNSLLLLLIARKMVGRNRELLTQ